MWQEENVFFNIVYFLSILITADLLYKVHHSWMIEKINQKLEKVVCLIYM